MRIFADFNSGGLEGQGPRWVLRFGQHQEPLDEMAQELKLKDGMQVILFYEDESEEFEVAATLNEYEKSAVRWQALPDWTTIRRIR